MDTRPPLPAALHPGVAQRHPEVALPWLIRMRWVAVTGQAFTILMVALGLGVGLPIAPLGAVILITFSTNVALLILCRVLTACGERTAQV